MFHANGDTHQTVRDTCLQTRFRLHASVRHAGWVLNQTLNTTQADCQREDADTIHQAFASFQSALQLESDHRTGHAHLALGQLMLGMALKTRVPDALYCRVLLQESGHFGCILALPLHTQRQCLDAAMYQECLVRVHRATQSVQLFAAARESLFVAYDNDSCHDIRMAVEEFGHAVHDDVGAQIEGLLQHGAHESVVHYGNGSTLVCNGGDLFNIDDGQCGISWSFEIDHSRVVAHVLLDYGRIRHVDEVCLYAKASEDGRKQSLGRSVHSIAAEHVIALAEVRRKGSIDRCHAAGTGKGLVSTFKDGNRIFHGLHCRIAQTSINVALTLARKELRALIGIVKSECADLVDRCDNGTVLVIRTTGMNDLCLYLSGTNIFHRGLLSLEWNTESTKPEGLMQICKAARPLQVCLLPYSFIKIGAGMGLQSVFQKRRILVSRFFALLALVVLLFSSMPISEHALTLDLLHWLGFLLIMCCVFGRLWSLLYLTGYKTTRLIDQGPFSVMRNPLYFFSSLGALGFGLVANHWLLLAGILLAFLVYYPFVVVSEEQHLKRDLGEDYTSYCKRVNRFLPSFSGLQQPDVWELRARKYSRVYLDAIWFPVAYMLIRVLLQVKAAGLLPVLWG